MPNEITSNEIVKGFFPGIRTADEIAPVRIVPTKWPSFNDIILGCGGIPRGRTIELYSPPSAGKTTVALNLVSCYQEQGLRVAWDDREGTFPDANYTDGIPIDREQMNMMDTADGNDACYQFELMAALNLMDLYVIDSATMMLPKNASVVGDTEEASMYEKLQRASLLTSFFQKMRSGYYIGKPGTMKKNGTYNLGDLIPAEKEYFIDGKLTKNFHKLSDKDVTLIMINHEKQKIETGFKARFGDKSTTPGGEATKFDASLRLQIKFKKKSKEKIDGKPAYKIITIKAVKNKVAPPFGEAPFMLWRNGAMEEYTKGLKGLNDDSDTEDVTAEDYE